jgi:TP901 family phage tail tape measure protein
MAKLDILIRADNQTGGPIGQIKKAISGLGGAAGATLAAAGLAAAGAVTAITGAVVVGVGKAAQLEQGVADIASVMGITMDEAKPLGDLIANLGMDPKLKVDAVGASDAIMQLAQSGVSMSDIMAGAARNTVLLANATGGDMTTSAAVASDAMALFGIKAEDMGKAVNGITGVTVASKFGIQDYALALAQGGGVAAAVGVSFEDFNTTIAAISPYFSSGSDAGTSFKTMLQRMVPSSNEAKDAMMQLGLITADGKNQFFDANGQMKDMKDIAGILNTALGGLTEEQKNAALATIFGSDAMRAAVALADAGSGKFDTLAASIDKIDAEESAGTRMNTFSGQLEILQGVIDGVLTKIGMAFLPVLKDLTTWASGFISDHGPAITKWFEDFAGWIKDITPLATAWGQVFMAAMGEIGAWLQGQDTNFQYLRNLWDLLSASVRFAVDAILTYVRTNWPNWVENMKQWGGAAWQWIVDAMPIVLDKLYRLVAAVFAYVRDNWPSWVESLRQWGLAAWQWIVDAMPTVLAKIGDWWGLLLNYIKTNLPNWIENLKGWAGAIWQWIVDATPTVMGKLGEMWNSISSWVTDEKKRTALLAWLTNTWNGFTTWAGSLWENVIKPRMAQMWLDFNAWIHDNVPVVSPWIDGFAGGIKSIIEGFQVHWPDIMAIVADARSKMGADVDRILESLNRISSYFSTGDGANGKRDWAGFWLGALQVVAGVGARMMDVIADIMEGIGLIFQAMKDMQGGNYDTALQAIARLGQLSLDLNLAGGGLNNLIPKDWFDQLQNIPVRATGGPVQAGMPYMVGELRPEVFVPQTSGTILPEAGSTTNNYWSVSLSGSGQAGNDVMQTVQMMQALYG